MRAMLICLLAAPLLAVAADGDLDATFGSGGKVRITYGDVQPGDVAEQSNGNLVLVGRRTDANNFVVVPLSASGAALGYIGVSCSGTCGFASVVTRADDRIVAGGTDGSNGVVMQFTANYPFAFDTSFHGSGQLYLVPDTAGDAIEIKRIALDSSGNVIAAGDYYHAGTGDDDFYIARISADGSSLTSAKYSFATAATNHDIAYDLALAADGTYYLAGTATSSAGDLDCGIAHFLYNGSALQADATFTGSPDTAGVTIGLNYGGDNNDNCLALAIQPPYGDLILGGQATAVLGVTWNVGFVITQPPNGLPNQRVPHTFWYDQSSPPQSGQVDTVKRVLIEPYDKRVLLVGDGPDRTAGTSQDFGVLRLSGPSTPDTSFGSGGFALYDVGSGTNANANYATSAVLTSRGLVIVGTAQDDTAGIDVALVRLVPFDGIFKNGFEGLSVF